MPTTLKKALAGPFTDTPASVIVHLLSFYEQHKEGTIDPTSVPPPEPQFISRISGA